MVAYQCIAVLRAMTTVRIDTTHTTAFFILESSVVDCVETLSTSFGYKTKIMTSQ